MLSGTPLPLALLTHRGAVKPYWLIGQMPVDVDSSTVILSASPQPRDGLSKLSFANKNISGKSFYNRAPLGRMAIQPPSPFFMKTI